MTEEQHIGILKAVVLCLQKEDYGIQNAGIWIMEQLVQEGCNLSLYKEMLLTPLLGCMLEKYPAFTHARSTVIGLIAHFVPSLDGNDFDVVLNSFQCIKELRIVSSHECAIETFGSLIVAIHHKAEEKKHFIDDLLPLIFKALKDEWNASSAEWVLENQVLTVMNQEQLTTMDCRTAKVD